MYMYKIFSVGKFYGMGQPSLEELKELFKPLLEQNSEEIYPIVKNPKSPRISKAFTKYAIMVSENKVDSIQKTVCGKNLRIEYLADLGKVTNEQAYNFINLLDLHRFNKHPHNYIDCKNIYKGVHISTNSYMLLVLSMAKFNTTEFNFPENIFINVNIRKKVSKNSMYDVIINAIKQDVKTASELLKSKNISYSGFGEPVAKSMKGFEFLSTLNAQKFRITLKTK